jgi:hypothetical protein
VAIVQISVKGASMHRHVTGRARLVAALALALLVAGCGGGKDDGPATGAGTTAPATSTPVTTGQAGAGAANGPTKEAMSQASGKAEQADTSASLPDGQHLAYVTAIDKLGREVRIDVVQYFQDQDAIDAAREDSKGTADIGDTEYYIRNTNRRLRYFKVDADARITLQQEAGETEISLEELALFAPDYKQWLFWVTVEKGKVRSMFQFPE